MKLKYYLRGLGIGILVTAVILSIASGRKEEMTDAEVIARAKELGMVENMMLSDMNAPTEPPAATEAPKATEPPAATEAPKATEPPVVTEVPETTPLPDETAAPLETTLPEGETVTIVITSGQSSVSVSRQLENAGLIEDASDYDKYLCENGYDKKIRVGTYAIPTGASQEEIARIITGF